MNENSSLRYLGEAYDMVRINVEPIWTALGGETAIQAYTLMAAAAFALYGIVTVSRSLRGAAVAVRGAVRRS